MRIDDGLVAGLRVAATTGGQQRIGARQGRTTGGVCKRRWIGLLELRVVEPCIAVAEKVMGAIAVGVQAHRPLAGMDRFIGAAQADERRGEIDQHVRGCVLVERTFDLLE